MSAQPFVLTSAKDGVGRLVLNDPERLNPVTLARIRELNEAARKMSARDDVHVVVITGAGRGFCSGVDLRAPVISPGERLPPASGGVFGDGPGVWTLTGMRQPVIAMVNGAAVGFGFELALQADIRIASESAKFGLPFAKLGTVSDTGAGSWLLPRLVGYSRAAEILYTGRLFTANEMLERGVVSEVVPDGSLASVVDELATDIASGSPWALRALKEMLFSGLEQSRAHHVFEQYQRSNERPLDLDDNEYVKRFRGSS